MTTSAGSLAGDALAFVTAARRATLATIAPDGHPRLVPVCFVILEAAGGPRIYTPLDDKPKRTGDPLGLARVRDIAERPTVALLVDRWDEDWSRLAWVRVDGPADLLAPDAGAEHAAAVAALRAKHAQYRDHALDERPLIRVAVGRVTSWGDLGA
jgi:PPOX class probable F420-dependent enzyme